VKDIHKDFDTESTGCHGRHGKGHIESSGNRDSDFPMACRPAAQYAERRARRAERKDL